MRAVRLLMVVAMLAAGSLGAAACATPGSTTSPIPQAVQDFGVTVFNLWCHFTNTCPPVPIITEG